MVHQFLSSFSQVPWGVQSPTLCSVSLSSFPCVSACYVLLLTYIGHVTCGTPLPSLLPLPPLSLECANLYHSHHFLSFCMLRFAVLAYYNLQNTTNPSPTSPPHSLGCIHLYHSHHFLVLLQAVLCC